MLKKGNYCSDRAEYGVVSLEIQRIEQRTLQRMRQRETASGQTDPLQGLLFDCMNYHREVAAEKDVFLSC